MRVTQGMINRNLLQYLAGNFEQLAEIQEKLSTGQRVNTVSDDPVAATQILYLQRENERLTAYSNNIQDAKTMLRTATDSLQSTSETLVSVKELAVQAATGTYTDRERQSMAEGVDHLLQSLVNLANVQSRGLYVFSGEATDTSPYQTVTDASGTILAVEYQGAPLSTEVRVGPSSYAEANLVGTEAFEGRGDIFATLVTLRDAIRSGDEEQIRAAMGDLEAGHADVTQSVGRLGERLNQTEILETTYERFRGINEETLSATRDADIAELTVEYSSQTVLLEMVVQLAAQAAQPSLMDYI